MSNATAMCKVGKKEFKHWNSLISTKKIIKSLGDMLKVPSSQLIDVKKGCTSKYQQGSWIHPLLATNLAQWISSDFGLKVCLWIDEWKQFNNNKNIYDNEINNLVSNEICQKEREIQLKLLKELGGEIEVETESGFIDLLTDNEIIEIKNGKNWKSAVGQILIYSLEYPKHGKRIHLFDIENDSNINNKCSIYNIKVSYE